jgi:hypothetical protein
MLKITLYILFFILSRSTFGQNFLNGDFEINSASGDQINLLNPAFNTFMPNTNGYGTSGNLDIITSTVYSGGPHHGNWFIGFTGGGTDLLSLKLTAPLVAGNTYTVTFYDKKDANFVSLPIEISVSTSNNTAGTLVYTTPSPSINSIWTQRTFTFTAPNNGQFIAVRQQGSISNWVQLDDFSFSGCVYDQNLGNDTTLCQGQSITLNADPAVSYVWSNGSTTPSVNISSPGIYWILTDNGQCSATDSIIISVDQYPSPDLGNDLSLCLGQSVTLNADSAISYLWSNGITTRSVNVSVAGLYWVQATNGQLPILATI